MYFLSKQMCVKMIRIGFKLYIKELGLEICHFGTKSKGLHCMYFITHILVFVSTTGWYLFKKRCWRYTHIFEFF